MISHFPCFSNYTVSLAFTDLVTCHRLIYNAFCIHSQITSILHCISHLLIFECKTALVSRLLEHNFYATCREPHSTMQPCVVVMLWTILWQRGHTSTTKTKMVYGNSFMHNLSTKILIWLEFQSLACSRLSKNDRHSQRWFAAKIFKHPHF